MIIAVDFDGTIVKNKFPAIGEEIPFAIDSLLMLQKKGVRIILWTSRHGEHLTEAIRYCRKRGLEFYAVNKNYPEESVNSEVSRKIVADWYLDSRNLSGLPSWGEIYQTLVEELNPKPKSKGFKSLFSWKKS
ncbi:BT0820 family HAD-type phosphatase [Mangrovibacterium diazotrophicum]|uniref:Hydrolase n=1 Tax=Mangrovibacterium diazotrophicum TaxID=1261403 RepID=A0A419W958_9BACT|nr:hydrolase [Mangrovibacterium diazotrophicum]RKD92008.1 hypothetical protein BC643_2377 [Mangrovibacterium diazotrophicum]